MAGIFIALRTWTIRTVFLKVHGVAWVTSSSFFRQAMPGLSHEIRSVIIWYLSFRYLPVSHCGNPTKWNYKEKISKFYQTVFFFPYFFSWIIVSYMLYSFIGPLDNYNQACQYRNRLVRLLHYTVDMANLIKPDWPMEDRWVYFGHILCRDHGHLSGILWSCGNRRCNAVPDCKKYYDTASDAVISIMTLYRLGRFLFWFRFIFLCPQGSGATVPVTQTIDTYVFRMLRTSGDIGMSSAVGFTSRPWDFFLSLRATSW